MDRLRVPDPDANENGAVVLFGGDGDNFEVQPNGVVITRRPLDREMLSHYSFVLYARDNAFERRQTSSSTVHVQVMDLNDWAPVFIYPQREGMNFTVSYRVSAASFLIFPFSGGIPSFLLSRCRSWTLRLQHFLSNGTRVPSHDHP